MVKEIQLLTEIEDYQIFLLTGEYLIPHPCQNGQWMNVECCDMTVGLLSTNVEGNPTPD